MEPCRDAGEKRGGRYLIPGMGARSRQVDRCRRLRARPGEKTPGPAARVSEERMSEERMSDGCMSDGRMSDGRMSESTRPPG